MENTDTRNMDGYKYSVALPIGEKPEKPEGWQLADDETAIAYIGISGDGWNIQYTAWLPWNNDYKNDIYEIAGEIADDIYSNTELPSNWEEDYTGAICIVPQGKYAEYGDLQYFDEIPIQDGIYFSAVRARENTIADIYRTEAKIWNY